MPGLDGSVALITGASRGQGEAIARHFVSEGAKVVIGDLLDEEGMAVAASLGPDARYVRLDVTSPEAWEGAVKVGVEAFGKLTTLVNNAGIQVVCSIEDMSLATYERVIAVNQVGCWLGMKTVLPAIRDAGGGAIVNTSSLAGLVGMPDRSAYVASKFAIRGMTKVAAIEFGRYGIRVNCVVPGAITTPMLSEGAEQFLVNLPVPRAGRPDEVAKLVAFLCSDDSSYCSGAEFVIDGGANAGG